MSVDVQPCNDHVLVSPITAHKVGEIQLSSESRRGVSVGKVLAASGDDIRTYKGKTIVFRESEAALLDYGGDTFFLVESDKVLALIDKEES